MLSNEFIGGYIFLKKHVDVIEQKQQRLDAKRVTFIERSSVVQVYTSTTKEHN